MSSLDEQNDRERSVVVTLKMAFDRSWGVADLSQEKSERFTSPGSLDLVHRLRRCSDVVLVGRTTVERDDCTLTVRRVPSKKQPVRVVIDPKLTLLQENNAKSYQLLRDGLAPTIVYCAEGGVSNDVDLSWNDQVLIAPLAEKTNGSLLLAIDILQDLKDRGLYEIMVEGGPATAREFLKEQMVDRAILIRAPLEFREPFPSHITCQSLQDAGLQFLGSSLCDGDTVEYWSRPNLQWPTDKLEEWP
jgi:riboflavin-specific deaminase-like protein